MDLRKLKTLIELVESSGIAELEIQEGEERVRITRARRRRRPQATAPTRHAPVAPAPLAPSPRRAGPPRRAGRAGGPPRQEPDGRHVLSLGVAGRQAVRRGRRHGAGRRHAVHHRGDEADERDRVRQGRRGQGRSSSRTGSRSSSASRSSSSADRPDVAAAPCLVARSVAPRTAEPAVRQGPDRQSRRDRAAHPARVPRARHQDGRRLLRGRPRRQVRAPRRRIGVHRPAAVRAELPQHAGDHRRGRGHRRAGDPSRLRLPVGERRLRRQGRAVRLRVHRPARRHDPPDGRQGQRQGGDDQGRRALRARVGGRAARRPEGNRAASRARSATR